MPERFAGRRAVAIARALGARGSEFGGGRDAWRVPDRAPCAVSDSFGEPALMHGSPRAAPVRAWGDYVLRRPRTPGLPGHRRVVIPSLLRCSN